MCRIVAIWATIWATCDTARLAGLPPDGPVRLRRVALDAMAGLPAVLVALSRRAAVAPSYGLDAGAMVARSMLALLLAAVVVTLARLRDDSAMTGCRPLSVACPRRGDGGVLDAGVAVVCALPAVPSRRHLFLAQRSRLL
jgi:hypothetical protein